MHVSIFITYSENMIRIINRLMAITDTPVRQLLLVVSSHFPAVHSVHVSASGLHAMQSTSVHAAMKKNKYKIE